MTVTYTAEVATCAKFGCFIKLLARWKGSIYKLIWMDLILFLTLYYCINMIYIYQLGEESKRTFESIVYYCASYTSLIPLSFVLGFYVNLVMTRWWEQYMTIPWIDSLAVYVSAHVHGQDEGGRVMRRTVMRYVCLCLTIVFTMISPGVKKRFPKMKSLVEAGLLLENEKKIIESMDDSFPKYPKHWMPIIWAASIITRARKEGRIRDDFAVKTIIDELNKFRGLCGTLMYYDFISIPLVYTQVVTIAVYSFFVCSLLAHQWTESKINTHEAMDLYCPIFITLQFFFYMGWLKVAETLINPFGEDDDDFEVNWMIDRNLQVSYLIVDEMHHEHPELVKDQYWDEVYPNELPYESDAKREQPPEPSTAKYDVEETKITFSTNSVVMNGKISSEEQSALNQQDQKCNDEIEKFYNFTEEDDVIIKREPKEKSYISISEIENIQHITSYTTSEDMFDSQYATGAVLETVAEESEEISEEFHEETENLEEEEDNRVETQSSDESDTDSDPFERLRIERQQQRLQRMNDYLERYFGPNYRIVTENFEKLEKQAKSNKTELINDNEENKSLRDVKLNSENLLTVAVSTSSTNNDKTITSNQEVQGKSLMDQGNDDVKLSSITLIPLPIKSTSALHTKKNEETSVNEQLLDSPEALINFESDIPRASRSSTLFSSEISAENSNNSKVFWQTKATSPMSSAGSASTQSPEILPIERPNTIREYIVDIEKTEDEHNAGRE